MSGIKKFRAWDKKFRKFVPPVSFSIAANTVKIDVVNWKEWEYSEDPYDFILMAFTGLKDKNDNDIYEGDIVSAYKITHVIEFIESHAKFGYIFEDCSKIHYCSISHDHQYFTVVGNIYENPELLTKKVNK